MAVDFSISPSVSVLYGTRFFDFPIGLRPLWDSNFRFPNRFPSSMALDSSIFSSVSVLYGTIFRFPHRLPSSMALDFSTVRAQCGSGFSDRRRSPHSFPTDAAAAPRARARHPESHCGRVRAASLRSMSRSGGPAELRQGISEVEVVRLVDQPVVVASREEEKTPRQVREKFL